MSEYQSLIGGRARRHDTRLQGKACVTVLMEGHDTVVVEETRTPRMIFRRLVRWIELNQRMISSEQYFKEY